MVVVSVSIAGSFRFYFSIRRDCFIVVFVLSYGLGIVLSCEFLFS